MKLELIFKKNSEKFYRAGYFNGSINWFKKFFHKREAFDDQQFCENFRGIVDF